MRDREAQVQLWLASVHLVAAAVTLTWAVTHTLAAGHHLARMVPAPEPETDATPESVAAFLRGQRR